MNQRLTLDALRSVVDGSAVALRCVTEYQPAGGPGDKVFPPTYAGGQYAIEQRVIPASLLRDGESEKHPINCVLLDSVQPQANRMELALQDAWEARDLPLPVITVSFDGKGLRKSLRVTSLEAPHRIADSAR